MIFTPPPMSLIERSPGWAWPLLNRLGEAGLERRHVLLEAGRVDVRQVVGDDFQPLRPGRRRLRPRCTFRTAWQTSKSQVRPPALAAC